MRLSLRLIVPVVICIALVSALFAYDQVQTRKQALREELDNRATLDARALQDSLESILEKGSFGELKRAIIRTTEHQQLAGAVLFDTNGKVLLSTEHLPLDPSAVSGLLQQVVGSGLGHGGFLQAGGGYFHAYVMPLHRGDGQTFDLAVFHYADYIRDQSSQIWQNTLGHVTLEVLLIVLITFLIVRWSVEGPMARTAQWIKALRTGKAPARAGVPRGELFQPLAKELQDVVKSLNAARAAAKREAQLREAAESVWTAERLTIHVGKRLQQRRMVVVSNREPYIHTRQYGPLEVTVPASGLVTALEPILRACDGTWIAHGSGDADREAVDVRNRLRVPPDDPQYTLRRVWLSRKEEEGYYFGFANEGLWALCHIAHTRPVFRSDNWEYYQIANQKFADAVLDEIAGTSQPCVLVQDYHFALLPRLIKKERPDARVAIFWHIPWPNPEAFGICPWERELLDGLLGADVVSFHIQTHCNNFLETVAQALESRIEWEGFAVNRKGHLTRVRPFPISIDFTDPHEDASALRESPYVDRAALLAGSGVQAAFMGVGVDRVDYTKGILERFRGIERFLEKYPSYQGKFTFVQIGAPSRMEIQRYQELYASVEAEADRINRRFQNGVWRPIVLRKRHHSHMEIERFYRAADVCLVTSLHDGMNLVAKEYIAARDDERGVLILSRFAGACHELKDALIINPYDTEQVADAIRESLEMNPDEIEQRMQRMRRTVREYNIYRWAANLITELSEIRPETPEPKPDHPHPQWEIEVG